MREKAVSLVMAGGLLVAVLGPNLRGKDRAQGALNFFVFVTLAVTSFGSGVVITTQGWNWLNYGSVIPVALIAAALIWLALRTSRPATV
jgi:hypothetical protein